MPGGRLGGIWCRPGCLCWSRVVFGTPLGSLLWVFFLKKKLIVFFAEHSLHLNIAGTYNDSIRGNKTSNTKKQ